MGIVDWMFRSRKTGRITLAQFPNWPLAAWMLASAVIWLGHPQGWVRTVFVVLSSAALALWAGDERSASTSRTSPATTRPTAPWLGSCVPVVAVDHQPRPTLRR